MRPAQTSEAAEGTSLSHAVSEHWRRRGVGHMFDGTVLTFIIIIILSSMFIAGGERRTNLERVTACTRLFCLLQKCQINK